MVIMASWKYLEDSQPKIFYPFGGEIFAALSWVGVSLLGGSNQVRRSRLVMEEVSHFRMMFGMEMINIIKFLVDFFEF